MTPQISTDPSQSKRLLDCGVNPDTADFVWMEDNPPRLTLRTEIIEGNNPYILAPSWSLSALLALLPKEIEDGEYGFIWLEVVWLHEDKNVVTIRYFTPPNESDDDCDSWEFSDNIIETCVKAIEWLTANGYSLNDISNDQGRETEGLPLCMRHALH